MITKYEISFKLRDDKIDNELRFLNLDCNAYSNLSRSQFDRRLSLFIKIIQSKIINNLTDNYLSLPEQRL